jgi:hypothetical protein
VILRQLQQRLASLYDAPAAHDVCDFLISDGAHAARLQGADGVPPTDEQLLLAEAEDGVEIALYVDAGVLERLGRHCPLRALDERNLADFLTALEGVSHFHYYTWSASHARTVSLLELELQAEVDKYASALRLLLEQGKGRFPAGLHERLFARSRLRPGLAPSDHSRYAEAHRCAARFCRRLEERFLSPRRARPEGLLAELRAFYRLASVAKLRHATL